MNKQIDTETLFDEIDHDTLVKFLKLTIKRIDFFSKESKLWTNKQRKQYYDWFVMTNLLDLFAFSSALKINNDINPNNPFFIWSFHFNEYKHLAMERETSLTLYWYTHKIPAKYATRNELKGENLKILYYLDSKFWANIQNDNFRHYSLEQKIDAWLNIKNFLLFILENKPVNFLDCQGTYFDDHKKELYSWFEEKHN